MRYFSVSFIPVLDEIHHMFPVEASLRNVFT